MVVYDIDGSLPETVNSPKKYRMQFSYNNGEVTVTMPHCQTDLEIQTSQANETYNGLSMPLSMLGNAELRQISISTFLPSKKYTWMDSLSVANPQYYINFFNTVMKNKIPMRIRVYCNNDIILDLPVCINALNYSIQKNSDYLLALNLQEYKLVAIKKAGVDNG